MATCVMNETADLGQLKLRFERFLSRSKGMDVDLAEAVRKDYRIVVLARKNTALTVEMLRRALDLNDVDIVFVDSHGRPDREPFVPSREPEEDVFEEIHFLLDGSIVLDAAQLLWLSRGGSIGTVHYKLGKGYGQLRSPAWELRDHCIAEPPVLNEDTGYWEYSEELHREVTGFLRLE